MHPSPASSLRSTGDNSTSFKQNQEQYFSEILGRKWDCDVAGHTVCVPTLDGRHRRLSEDDVSYWVQALCAGEATTAQPPEWIMNYSLPSSSPSLNSSGLFARGAVSIPPSRSRNSGSCNSYYSSGVPGVGYLSGRALKWLGTKVLGAVEDTVIIKRCRKHQAVLARWQRPDCTDTWEEKQAALFPILEDALELSRASYSQTFNKSAFLLGREIQRWLRAPRDIPRTRKAAALVALVKICILPLILSRISRSDPHAGDLAWDLVEALTRVPLQFYDSKTTSDAICIVAKELAYATYTRQHSWLGVDLRCIIGTTLQARLLTPEELNAIHAMAVRRSEQNNTQGHEFSRPWEVAIFAECAAQDPRFKYFVLGPHGFESLIANLHLVGAEPVQNPDRDWEHLSLILRSLAFLSEYEWIASVVKPELLTLLLQIFRRNTPARWFPIQFWIIDAIRNVVSHRSEMLHHLVLAHAGRDFANLIAESVPVGSTPSLMDYRNEARELAKDLLRRMQTWDTDTPRNSSDTIAVVRSVPKTPSKRPQSPLPINISRFEQRPDAYLTLDIEFPWTMEEMLHGLEAEDTALQ